MATLTVTDNADGTGGVATISGDTGGHSFQVKHRLLHPFTYDAAVDDAIIVSNNSAAVTPAVGNYWWYAQQLSMGGDVLGPVFQPITEVGDSILERCLQAVAEIVSLLNLSGVGVEAQTYPIFENLNFPCVLCFLSEGTPAELAGMTETYERSLPITVAVLHRKAQADATARRKMLNWRQQAVNALGPNRRRLGYYAPEVNTVNLVQGPSFQLAGTEKLILLASQFTVSCVVRELRPQ